MKSQAQLQTYCGECALTCSPALLKTNPYKTETNIELQESIEITEGDTVKRKIKTTRYVQKPAKICESCLSDVEEIPTSDPIYV